MGNGKQRQKNKSGQLTREQILNKILKNMLRVVNYDHHRLIRPLQIYIDAAESTLTFLKKHKSVDYESTKDFEKALTELLEPYRLECKDIKQFTGMSVELFDTLFFGDSGYRINYNSDYMNYYFDSDDEEDECCDCDYYESCNICENHDQEEDDEDDEECKPYKKQEVFEHMRLMTKYVNNISLYESDVITDFDDFLMKHIERILPDMKVINSILSDWTKCTPGSKYPSPMDMISSYQGGGFSLT